MNNGNWCKTYFISTLEFFDVTWGHVEWKLFDLVRGMFAVHPHSPPLLLLLLLPTMNADGKEVYEGGRWIRWKSTAVKGKKGTKRTKGLLAGLRWVLVCGTCGLFSVFTFVALFQWTRMDFFSGKWNPKLTTWALTERLYYSTRRFTEYARNINPKIYRSHKITHHASRRKLCLQ